MAHSAKSRTSQWINTSLSATPVEDIDVPLDFSIKKRKSPEVDDAASEAGSSCSSSNRAESPPASMIGLNSHLNPLLRTQNAGNINKFFSTGQNFPAFAFPNMTEARSKGSKPIRPFKAYPRDPLSLPLGLYGFPLNLGLPNGVLDSINPQMFSGSQDSFLQYKQNAEALLAGVSIKKGTNSHVSTAPAPKVPKKLKPEPKPIGTNGVVSSSVKRPSEGKATGPKIDVSAAVGSPDAVADSTASTSMSPSPGDDKDRSESKTPEPGTEDNGKKRARSVPDDIKDEAYWERRRKNNEAAKRSRDARRAKEDDIALRAAFLENENMRLQVQVQSLKNETEKLRCMLFNS